MIPVKVAQLSVAQISPSDVSFVLLLRGIEDERSLPIFIAATEAQSIAIKLNGREFPRPLTHDLLKNILESNACTLRKVEVCDLVDNTFYARLVIEQAGRESEVDSRPSDAIALALRCAAPIFVAESVMDRAGVVVEEGDTDDQTRIAGGEDDEGTTASPLENLKQRLESAIRDERYEDAAELRDEIKRVEDEQATN